MQPDPMTGSLGPLRDQIDLIDEKILGLLRDRFEVVEQVGKLKTELGLGPLQGGRKQQVFERLKSMSAELSLDPEFTRKLFEQIHDESLRLQTK